MSFLTGALLPEAPSASAFSHTGSSGHPFLDETVRLGGDGRLSAAQPVDRGLYALGHGNRSDILNLPFLTGGQVALQWAELETGEGQYDFRRLDHELRLMHDRNKMAIVKINGDNKPAWLYRAVPVHPVALSPQIEAPDEGTLMYWHPTFKAAYKRFLEAYAKYLKRSQYKSTVVALRLNYNAMGTEHTIVNAEDAGISNWVAPPGVELGRPWTREIMEDYKEMVVDTFVANFLPDFGVLVRTNIEDDVIKKYQDEFERGLLGWFHTGAGMEQNQVHNADHRYQRFLTFTRTGKTFGFTESASYARVEDEWPRAQYNYWRLLSDLHSGISYIGVHRAELAHANSGEFRQAFLFAAKYVGLHAVPERAPGAWVALGGSSEDNSTGDYTFHMRRLQPDRSVEVRNVGPATQRYGAWASKLPAGESLYFDLHDDFFPQDSRRRDQPVTVRVVYLDEGKGEWRLAYETLKGTRKVLTRVKTGSDIWREELFALDDGDFSGRNPGDPDLAIENGGEGTTFHMIEVIRR